MNTAEHEANMSETSSYPPAFQKIAGYFGHLPGIGKRTAERLTLALMTWKPEEVAAFGHDLAAFRDNVVTCPVCGSYMQVDGQCRICTAPARQRDIICVVETASQIPVIEKTGCYHGQYHVLGGKLSPMNGIGPADLRITELRTRLANGEVHELLIALPADVEGEATSHFLAHELAAPGLAISRIAAGIPVGVDLAFADTATMASAISGRRMMDDRD